MIPWRRARQPTPVFLPAKSHGQRSLVGYSPWGSKESESTEQTCTEIESEVSQSCPTLCEPMDCSLPGSSVHEILQARVLEWVAISFSRGSSICTCALKQIIDMVRSFSITLSSLVLRYFCRENYFSVWNTIQP